MVIVVGISDTVDQESYQLLGSAGYSPLHEVSKLYLLALWGWCPPHEDPGEV